VHDVAHDHAEHPVDGDAEQHGDIGVQQERRRHRRDDAGQLGQHHDGELLVEGEVAAEVDGADVGDAVQQRQAGDEQQHRPQPLVGEEAGSGIGERRHHQGDRQTAQQVQRERGVVEVAPGGGLANDGFLGAEGQHAVDGLHEAGGEGDDAEIRRLDQPHQHQGAEQAEDARAKPPGHDPAGAAGGAEQQAGGRLGEGLGLGQGTIGITQQVPEAANLDVLRGDRS